MSLNTYIPEVRHPIIGGKSVTVAPLKVRQIPPFLRAVGPVASQLANGDIAGALASHGEDLVRAISVAVDQPVEWLGDLDADDFMRLVADVVEVNADFFVQRLTPTLEETMARINRRLTPGETPSQSSYPAASAGANA